MSRRPMRSCRRRRRTAGDSPYALNDRLRDVEADRARPHRRPGGRDPRRGRQSSMCGNRTGDIVRFFAPDYTRQEVFAHIGGRPLGMAFDKRRLTALLHRRHGPLPRHHGPRRREADRRDQPLAGSRSSTTPACGWPTISTSRPTAGSSSAKRRSATRCTNGRSMRSEVARQWPHHLLRPATTTRRGRCCKNLVFPNGICMTHDGQSFLFAETWACRVSRYWFDGPKARAGRAGHRRSAGLSRQHQPRLGRHLLAGAGRHAHAVARPGAEDAGLPQAHGAAGRARRVAVSQHQHRLRRPVRRDGQHHRRRCGIAAARTIR